MITKVEQWLGSENKIGLKIYEDKYRYKNESFKDFIDRLSSKDRKMRAMLINKDFLFGGRILANLNTGGTQGISNCFSGDTKIITKEGFKTLKELNGKHVKVLDKTGGFADGVVSTFGEQELFKLVLKKAGKEKIIYTTESHIWFASGSKRETKRGYPEVTTGNLEKGMFLKPSVARSYANYTVCPIGFAHGAFIGDGDHNGEHRKMSLCGEKVELLPYFTPSDNVSYSESTDTTYISGQPKHFRDFPSLDETSNYLFGFLSGLFATDGCMYSGRLSISSTKIEELRKIQDIMAVLGLPFNDIKKDTKISNLTNKEFDCYILGFPRKYINHKFFVRSKHIEQNLEFSTVKPPRYRVESVEKTSMVEEVYCVTVPSSNTFTLDGFILTHNCVTMSYLKDDLNSIMDTLKDVALSFKAEAGVGLCFSNIRPKDSKIGEFGKADGVLGFMRMFSEVADNISRGGARRGAILMGLHCDHPDVLDFIKIKKNNTGSTGEIKSANLSVLMTDEFMEHYIKGLNNRCDGVYRKDFVVASTGQVIEHEVDTVHIMDSIVDEPSKAFEPGLLYVDRFTETHLFGKMYSERELFTNACHTYDSKVLTDNGYIEIGDAIGKEITIWNGYEWSKTVPFKTGDRDEIWNVGLDNGLELNVNENHNFILKGRDGVVKTRNLSVGDKIETYSLPKTKDTEEELGIEVSVVSITKTGRFEPTCCLKELKNNSMVVNGVLNGNCSEFYGTDGTICLLGSMNVSMFVKDNKFDYVRFEKCVDVAITHMDKAHDYGIGRNGVALQNERARDYRGLGLGIIGLADLFVKLEIIYGSPESIELSRNITKSMRARSEKTSKGLAKSHGQPNGIKMLELKAKNERVELPTLGLRNNSLISIAPGGTIATMLGISTGIEPVFMSEYVRTMEDQSSNGEKIDYIVRHNAIEEYMIDNNLSEKPKHCVDSRDIDPIDKIKLLAAIQEHTDLSISNTTNFPKGTTCQEIKEMYIEGWKLKCKGITCYVSGSLDGVLNEAPKVKITDDKVLEKRVEQEMHGTNPKIDLPLACSS